MESLYRWRHRLGVKLVVLIAGVTSLTFATFAYLGLRTDQRDLIAEVVRGAALFSETIKSSTYHHMLADNRPEAYRIIETIGQQEGIERVRIFNKDGRITFSTAPNEIGAMVDTHAESCFACHADGEPIERPTVTSRSRIFTTNGHRSLGMVTPIYNERGCTQAACHTHSETQRVLGVVDISLSLAKIDEELAGLRRGKLAMAIVSVLFLVAAVAFFADRFLVRPVRALARATEQVARGDLEHRIEVNTPDELGALALSFNVMTDALKKTQGELGALMAGLERQVQERTSALKQAQDQLVQSEKMSSLGKLCASIAHEINNPLAGILTSAKLLLRNLDEGPPDEAARETSAKLLKLVQRETERCSTIVRNLLDFARQRPLSLKAVDVNGALDETLSLLSNQLSMQKVKLERRLSPVPPVMADFGQLRQAFLNIVLNAAEAMREGGTLGVSSGLIPGGLVEITVSDSGVGIPPDILPRVIDPFFTTKERGTGLGLSVVYGIVERHGGRVEIGSLVGKGTTVVVRLPAVAAAGGVASG
ncbi:MAG: sensor histidine kinase [Myxococcaceae bacterium]